jgi:hypothetical protein
MSMTGWLWRRRVLRSLFLLPEEAAWGGLAIGGMAGKSNHEIFTF